MNPSSAWRETSARDGALVDFQPRSYTVTVAPSIDTFLDRLGRSRCFVPAQPRRRPAHPSDQPDRDRQPPARPARRPATTRATICTSRFSTNHAWGEIPAGTWTLVVEDAGTGGTGSLVSFGLRFYGDDEGNNDTYYYTDDFATLSGDRATLTDAAGSDTINAAAITTDLIIDLTPGATSTIAGRCGPDRAGTVIENVYGGDGNDTLIGNDADNMIYGGHGTDTMTAARSGHAHGGLGADT